MNETKKTLARLNAREPKADMIYRLAKIAKVGVRCDVSLVDALKFSADQYDLRQGEFGALLGLNASHYSEVIAGKRRLSLAATKRAYALGVPAVALLQK